MVPTPNSNHTRPIYPNLARAMTLTGINQLWVADITYIRLELEFVYLAVILDVFSRRVIGWALDRTLEDELTIAALQMALGNRSPAPGLVHHSDRYVQYASGDYTDLLKDRQITISMSRRETLTTTHSANVHEDAQIRRSTPPSIGIRQKRGLPSSTSSNGSTTRNGLPRRWLRRAGTSKCRSQAGSRSAGMKAIVRFPRHTGIYRSDVSPHLTDQQPKHRIPTVRPQPKGRAGSFHALLIVATSSDRLFLNGVLASTPVSASPAALS